MKGNVIILLLGILFLITGCQTANNEEKTIYVAAASDLYHALTEIGLEFMEETDIKVEFTFGSTGLLTQQIQEGAPFDLFASAHESYVDKLVEVGAIIPNSKNYYAIGRIVIMGESPGRNLDEQLLLDPEIRTITIANPEHAPYGKAAKEALEAWGIWEEVEPKLVYAENIRQAYQYVESGNADIGIIALALMTNTDYTYELIDESNHQPIVQALGITKQTEMEEESRLFADFMLSARGQEILMKYGFDLP
ncbi:molybdate ABC transporter substrate-binding protein [Halalkalibacter akibai]|uniref:Molybdenum ABC transporter n=1 Tax=Halalkalibacter akibai (strain ATCC 43226 / DSM 21942 / CIP 109018 / JCM 9157 / 1139) TaxID=1236973 RepID=W4QSF8_HALA3|nr:molybdate ABC transporter substrate-binding protein [Halalkalibacter akibai]GAE35050.1 molybdenum ABC transporter [Halalkalibacter akibai JCM 9157]